MASSISCISQCPLLTQCTQSPVSIEFANQLREQGLDTLAAIKQSAAQRLRPIMMTTGAMVLGAVPLAIATGAGAESRKQIGWVIVGGMSLGTLLTIFVVPTMYTLLARKFAPGAKTEKALDDVPAPAVAPQITASAHPPAVPPAVAASTGIPVAAAE